MRAFAPALALLGLLFAATAGAAPRIPAVAPPERVRAGGEYETAIPALPGEIEEFELFVLPADGSGRMIRVTPEHEGYAASLRWRMPRVNATSARLVLRAGGEFGETESEPSAPFAVEPGPERGRAEVLRGEHELAWHFGEDAGGAEPALLPFGTATIFAGTRGFVAVETPRDAGARPPAASVRIAPPAAPAAVLPATTAPRSRRPAFVPMRN